MNEGQCLFTAGRLVCTLAPHVSNRHMTASGTAFGVVTGPEAPDPIPTSATLALPGDKLIFVFAGEPHERVGEMLREFIPAGIDFAVLNNCEQVVVCRPDPND